MLVNRRLRAAGLHLAISLILGICTFLLVYGVWYPAPFDKLAGGDFLTGLMIACDVTLGPLVTLIIFNPKKPKHELLRDVCLVAAVQFVALAYGLTSIYQARPIYIVYNAGQFNVLRANSLAPEAYIDMPADIPRYPKLGPLVIAASQPADAKIREQIMFRAATGGADIFQIPKYFISYKSIRDQAANRALTPEAFSRKHGGSVPALNRVLDDTKNGLGPYGLLPIVMDGKFAAALINKADGQIVKMTSL